MPDSDAVEIPTRTLVESMIRQDSTIDAGELYAVANTLGMTDQQVRLCIKRLVAEGQFTHEGRGRKAVLYATDRTRGALEPDIEFLRYMYRQDRGVEPWDGHWRLAAFGIPETARQARDAMRDTIVRLGGAPIQGGLYVSANPWEDRIAAAAAELGVTEYLTLLSTTDLLIGGTRTPRALAERLWPLDRLAAGHRRLLEVAQRILRALRAATPPTPTQRLTLQIELGTEFTRALDPDPLLPPELLPRGWVGAQARAAVAACWAELARTETPNATRVFQWYYDVTAEVLREQPARASTR
ncbi:PaaX family transcriptional regulator C-terminal domain-containing protein [Nocardia sp. NPDC056100]|uniref:PaaX family transcriptional regulator C-terminal domain-containing protein n=1 Tax=Nocardia sp. NPDC056100 TaxID=3345712 RepID=UPI0035DCC07C